MAEKVLNLEVKVNTKTGELEVLGNKFQKVGQKAKETKKSFSGLGQSANSLTGTLGKLVTGAGIVAFFKSSVSAALAEEEAILKLNNALKLNGEFTKELSSDIQKFSDRMQEQTGVTKTNVLNLFSLARSYTQTAGQAKAMTQAALDFSVVADISMTEAVRRLGRSFSGSIEDISKFVPEIRNLTKEQLAAGEAIGLVTKAFGGASEELQKGLPGQINKLKTQFNDLKIMVGEGVTPAFSKLIGVANSVLSNMEEFGIVIANIMATTTARIQGLSKMIASVFKLDFQGVKEESTQLKETLAIINAETEAQFIEAQNQKTNSLQEQSASRMAMVLEEAEEEKKVKAETSNDILAIEQNLAKAEAALDKNEFDRKFKIMKIEMQANRNQIKAKIKDETKRAQILDRLKVIEAKRTQELANAELRLKRQQALSVMETSLQALAIINNANSKGTKAQVRRARVILALEKSIAIARAIAAAASAGPFGAALAASQVALITAQFSQQSRAIGKAARVANQGNETFNVSTDLGGGQTLNETFGSGDFGQIGGGAAEGAGVGVGGGGAGPVVSRGTTGGGGGGVGQVINLNVNVGGISLAVGVDNLDIADRQVVLRALLEEFEREVPEAIKLALASEELQTKFSGLAV